MSEKEIVLFEVADIHCALDIEKIQEVIKLQDATTVYGVSEEVYGVINLRGNIVSIIDVKKVFGFEKTEVASDSRVIILLEDGEQIGVLVDSVDGAEIINSESLQPLPANMSTDYSKYFSQILQKDSSVICLLNSEVLLSEGLESVED